MAKEKESDPRSHRARDMPAIAWTHSASEPVKAAASIRAASASATAVASDKARCGWDQMPVYKTPEPEADGMIHPEMPVPDPDGIVRRFPGEIRPAGVGYTGAQRRIDAALRSTGDPFDRSVADWLNVDGLRSPVDQVSAIVQDALEGSDAKSYALAVETCSDGGSAFAFGRSLPTSPMCARLSLAEWARRDPGNGIVWLYALHAADQTGDRAAQGEALRRMAESSNFDLHSGAGSAAVARLSMAGEADLAAQVDLAMQAVAMNPVPPWAGLTGRCADKGGGDPQLAQVCRTIGAAVFDHSDTLIGRMLGASIHHLATGDASRLEQARRERVALGGTAAPQVGPGPCQAERVMLKDLANVGAMGELAAMRERARPVSRP